MNNFFKLTILLSFFSVLFFPLKSEEITENTSIIKKVKELGKFSEPKSYPAGMQKLFQTGCNAFSCTADNLTKDMLSRFSRKGVYLEKYPGTQLHAMAMFEVFYQKKLKDGEDKIEGFISTINEKKKNKKDIVSLIKLNEARKKMRSSLGMSLELNPEEAMENYWLMGDFLNAGEIKKNKVSSDIKKRKKIIREYKKIVSELKLQITKEKEKKFYDKISGNKLELKLEFNKDPYERFYEKTDKIKKKIISLPEGKTTLAKNFDKSLKEINNLTDFVEQNFKKEDQILGNKSLNLLGKKLSKIGTQLTKEYSNDVSKVDINKISKNASKKIPNVTSKIKNKGTRDNKELITDMSLINNKGFNVFKLNRNLKQFGVETIKYQDVLNFVQNKDSVEKPSKNIEVLSQNRISLTKKLMSKLGYSNSDINKEIEIIKSTGINSEQSQNILTARQMMIAGAGDKEIQNEINLWNSINISSLQDDAYVLALNARVQGIEAKKIKKEIEIVNAVETYREVDKLLDKVEEQIEKSNLSTSVPDDQDLDENSLVFAQVGGSGYANNFFSADGKEMFYGKFLEEQKNKQIKVFNQKYTASEIYKEINTPLTIVSVIVSPTPYNIAKLALIAKEDAEEKKARVLAAARFGSGEDELGGGDYIDPRIFERTAKILDIIKANNLKSKSLSKKLNYSISMISVEATKNEISEQSNDAVSEVKKETIKDNFPKDVCIGTDCFVLEPPQKPDPINPIFPIADYFTKAGKVKKVDIIKDFQNMIQDKNISTRMISNKTLSNNKIIDIQFYLESTGIKDASEKVSKAYAEVGLSKDGMPSLDALIDPSFDIAAHLEAMDTVASEAGLQADIASASQAASDIQDAINAASGSISEDLAQANAEAQQALHDAQKALDESRQDPNRDRSGESCSSGGGTC